MYQYVCISTKNCWALIILNMIFAIPVLESLGLKFIFTSITCNPLISLYVVYNQGRLHGFQLGGGGDRTIHFIFTGLLPLNKISKKCYYFFSYYHIIKIKILRGFFPHYFAPVEPPLSIIIISHLLT